MDRFSRVAHIFAPGPKWRRRIKKSFALSLKWRRRVDWLDGKTSGWRYSVSACALSTFAVCTINLVATVWSVLHCGVHERRQTLYNGDCNTAGRINTGLHLVINILSTILLSSSNFCMQCLSAPTRAEVDLAHAKKIFLDIGILSTRNLRSIAWKRVILWWILGLSSLPLHLFYNSVVFSTINANDSYPIWVTKPFVENDPFKYFISSQGDNKTSTDILKWFGKNKVPDHQQDYNRTAAKRYLNATLSFDSLDFSAINLQRLIPAKKMKRLENLECINQYAKEFQQRGRLFLVLENSSVPAVLLGPYCRHPLAGNLDTAGNWVCCVAPLYALSSMPCELTKEINEIRSHPSEWAPGEGGERIAYCLSEEMPSTCKVFASIDLAVLVIIFNFIKAATMFAVVKWVKETPLMTVGDAVISFVAKSDPFTEGMPPASRKVVTNWKNWERKALKFEDKRQRVYTAVGKKMWILTLSLLTIMLALVVTFLALGLLSISRTKAGARTIWNLGFGRVSSITMIWFKRTPTGLVVNTLIANAAQPILSCLYFLYNGLFTAISSAYEWQSHTLNWKGLRVSEKPCGKQRTSHFLSLPYHFAIPLMALSSTLHWLVSQSIFLVGIQRRSIEGNFILDSSWVDLPSEFRCGFSPLAITTTLVFGIIMSLGAIAVGMLRFQTRVLVAANCSAAISAACHVPDGEDGYETSVSKVQWGATKYKDKDGISHYSFSSLLVTFLEKGKWYR